MTDEDILRVIRGVRNTERLMSTEPEIPGPTGGAVPIEITVTCVGAKVTIDDPPFPTSDGGLSEKGYWPGLLQIRNDDTEDDDDDFMTLDGADGDCLIQVLNDDDLVVDRFYKGTVTGYRNFKPVVLVEVGAPGPPGGTITVEDFDGTPSIPGVSLVRFDSVNGFTITGFGGDGVSIDMLSATATQNGNMSTGTQTFAGNKTFNGTITGNQTIFATGGQIGTNLTTSQVTYLDVDGTSNTCTWFNHANGRDNTFVWDGTAITVSIPSQFTQASDNVCNFYLFGPQSGTQQESWASYGVIRGTTLFGYTLHPGIDGAIPGGSDVKGGIVTRVGSTISGWITDHISPIRTIDGLTSPSTNDLANMLGALINDLKAHFYLD